MIKSPDNKEIVQSDSKEIVSVDSKELVKFEPILIEDSKVYHAEVIERFGSTLVGSKIEKEGSIIKILLEKKLIKLI